MTTFCVKALSAEDLPLLTNVAPDVFDNPIDEGLTKEYLSDPRHHIVVAVEDGTVIGFASAVHYIHPDKPAELWINEVGVSPAHRGKGVAQAILKDLLHLGKRLGCKLAWVLTDKSNLAANRLYRSAGGRVDPGDAVIYEFDTRNEAA
ncbi:MAG TPA: GNAT family N-acetyltransferase [Anaerolineales bacterium]|nr:GNAT family N-acetyltransferase [Anaerolineales bacterium]